MELEDDYDENGGNIDYGDFFVPFAQNVDANANNPPGFVVEQQQPMMIDLGVAPLAAGGVEGEGEGGGEEEDGGSGNEEANNNNNNNNANYRKQNILCDVVYTQRGKMTILDTYSQNRCQYVFPQNNRQCRRNTTIGYFCTRHTLQIGKVKIQFPGPRDLFQRFHTHVFIYNQRSEGFRCFDVATNNLTNAFEHVLKNTGYTVIVDLNDNNNDLIERILSVEDMLQYANVTYGPRTQYIRPFRRPFSVFDSENDAIVTYVLFRFHWYGDFIRRTSNPDEANCRVLHEGNSNVYYLAVEPFEESSIDSLRQYYELILYDHPFGGVGGGGISLDSNMGGVPNRVRCSRQQLEIRNMLGERIQEGVAVGGYGGALDWQMIQ
jgi:hypothetical protein